MCTLLIVGCVTENNDINDVLIVHEYLYIHYTSNMEIKDNLKTTKLFINLKWEG